MKFEVKKRELIPSGSYVGRCYSVVDLGTNDSPFGKNRQGYMTFELPTEMKVFDKDKGEKPLVKGFYFNFYLGNSTKFGKLLTAWRGREMADEEMKNFDVKKLLGVPCLVNITIIEKKGVKYNDIGILQMPKGMECPPQINPNLYFEFPDSGLPEDFNSEALEALPEWQRKLIIDSYEYSEIFSIKDDVNQIPEYEQPDLTPETDDDLPF